MRKILPKNFKKGDIILCNTRGWESPSYKNYIVTITDNDKTGYVYTSTSYPKGRVINNFSEFTNDFDFYLLTQEEADLIRLKS